MITGALGVPSKVSKEKMLEERRKMKDEKGMYRAAHMVAYSVVHSVAHSVAYTPYSVADSLA